MPSSRTRFASLATAIIAVVAVTPALAAPVQLDPDFADGGKLLLGGDLQYSQGDDLVGLAGGGAYVSGFDANGAVVWKLRPDGTLDPEFGDQGRAPVGDPASTGPLLYLSRLAVQADGKLVVGGPASDAAGTIDSRIVLARLLPSGEPDPSFGEQGIASVAVGGRITRPRSFDLVLTADGRIVLATRASDGGLAVARLLADGSPDPAFSGDGLRTLTVNGGGAAKSVAVTAGGGIVVGGHSGDTERHRRAVLARLEPDGTKDRSFGGDGIVATRFGHGGGAAVNALALGPGGRVVVVGTRTSKVKNRAGEARFRVSALVARFERDGRRDRGFSDGGVLETEPVGSKQADEFNTVLAPPNQRILVGGSSDKRFLLMRLDVDGRRDRSFSGDGRVTTSFGIGRARIEALALGRGGIVTAVGARIVNAAGGRTSYSSLAAARYLGTTR
jgi:uncharacterized delta-60 repeat protein